MSCPGRRCRTSARRPCMTGRCGSGSPGCRSLAPRTVREAARQVAAEGFAGRAAARAAEAAVAEDLQARTRTQYHLLLELVRQGESRGRDAGPPPEQDSLPGLEQRARAVLQALDPADRVSPHRRLRGAGRGGGGLQLLRPAAQSRRRADAPADRRDRRRDAGALGLGGERAGAGAELRPADRPGRRAHPALLPAGAGRCACGAGQAAGAAAALAAAPRGAIRLRATRAGIAASRSAHRPAGMAAGRLGADLRAVAHRGSGPARPGAARHGGDGAGDRRPRSATGSASTRAATWRRCRAG